MSEMSRAWKAISNDIDKKIAEHKSKFKTQDYIYHNNCVDGLLEAQGIVADHIGMD